MIPDNETFEKLEFKRIDELKLFEYIGGYTVIGAETIDYPLTDGILIYLQNNAEKFTAVRIEYIDDEFSVSVADY